MDGTYWKKKVHVGLTGELREGVYLGIRGGGFFFALFENEKALKGGITVQVAYYIDRKKGQTLLLKKSGKGQTFYGHCICDRYGNEVFVRFWGKVDEPKPCRAWPPSIFIKRWG